MLLPPFEDVQADNGKDVTKNDKINATTKVTPVTITTTTTTTKKPITKKVNNILPELWIEALLPPLYEAKIEDEETTTTTAKPTTTISTTIKTTTTSKPSTTTTTTTVKPSKIEVPELLLDPLLPPLLDNSIDNVKDDKQIVATTEKPSIAFKTTKKSYYAQPSKDLHLNDQKQQQLKHLHSAASIKEVKNYNDPSSVSSAASSSIKHVAESRIQAKQVSSATKHHVDKLHSKIENMTKQHVAKQVAQQRYSGTATKYQDKQYNYSFDFYLGSTTPRPPKSGLPTITPFPHRLGR
ncbi:uncharacterized protein ACRADG_013062 isoform 2-T2 [Cochliomyia hominivorax]